MFNLTPYNRRNGVDKRSKDVFDMERLFENFFHDTIFPTLYGAGDIKVDIRENEKEYVVEAELPGVKKEEISIDLSNDRLTIAVERNEEINVEKEGYIKRERKSGSMARTFYIPDVKENEVKARFDNGLLTLILPKQVPGMAKSSKITID